MKAFAAILISLLLSCSALAQTEMWPQTSRSLDYRVYYSEDHPTTRGMVFISRPPAHEFWMLSYEVSNKQWLEFIDHTGHPPPLCDFDMEDGWAYHQLHAWRGRSYPPGEGGLPVAFITKAEAELFCLWRTKQTGILHRLPTEEEWDAAAGPHKYPWGDSVDTLKCVSLGRHMQSGPDPFYAGTDDRNAEGVQFMLGNVREFTSAVEDDLIVIRGSGYDTSPRRASLKDRMLATSDFANRDIGFRYVIPVTKSGSLVRAEEQGEALSKLEIYQRRAALLHRAAMIMAVDYSTPPIPISMMSLYVSENENPNLGMFIPYWHFPVASLPVLFDEEGLPLIVTEKGDFGFGKKVMMGYHPRPYDEAVLEDPFNVTLKLRGIRFGRDYGVASVGPDTKEDVKGWYGTDSVAELVESIYDPTNGAISVGDIVYWGDEGGPFRPERQME